MLHENNRQQQYRNYRSTMGMMIHNGKCEQYVVEHDVSPHTLLAKDNAPSVIDIPHGDRATTGTNPSSSIHPFLHSRVRILLLPALSVLVATTVVVISVRTWRGYIPEASPYIGFGSHHDSEKAGSIRFHDMVRNANAMVGRADDEFVKSSNDHVNPPPDAKKNLLSDMVRDANMVIGPGDHELIGSLDSNVEVSSYDVLSSDDRHPEPKMLEEKLQINDDIIEFVYQSVISSADIRQEVMKHETIKMVGHSDDEFVSTTMGSVDSRDEDLSLQQSMESDDRHPEPKSLLEDLEIYNDIVRDTRSLVGQGDDEYVPGSQRSDDSLHEHDRSYDDSKGSNVRQHLEPNTLA